MRKDLQTAAYQKLKNLGWERPAENARKCPSLLVLRQIFELPQQPEQLPQVAVRQFSSSLEENCTAALASPQPPHPSILFWSVSLSLRANVPADRIQFEERVKVRPE
jgi:hypothetical protein